MMSFTSGTRLGPYEVLSRAGAGGMGEVTSNPLDGGVGERTKEAWRGVVRHNHSAMIASLLG
jgi:hypothetical protein